MSPFPSPSARGSLVRRICSSAVAVVALWSPTSAQALTRAELKHVVDRVSFGLEPDQLSTILTSADLNLYLRAQLLAPATGYGGAADALIAGSSFLNEGTGLNYTTPTWTVDDLRAKQVVLALESPYQLREVMTWFWEQHFSTFLVTIQGELNVVSGQLPAGVTPADAALFYEWKENQVYRSLALTDFRSLLGACVDSPAMRLYLHLFYSQCRGANEDFARECLELHTISPFKVGNPTIANYTTDDIQIAAEVFRGLSVDLATGVPSWGSLGGFYCHWNHPTIGQPLIQRDLFLGPMQGHVTNWSWTSNPQNLVDWQAELTSMLDNLAAQQQTKEFVCTKLIRWFVGDADPVFPPQLQTLLNNCVAVWGPRGDIKAVLGQIFASAAFRSGHYWERLENPLETTISQARILGAGLSAGGVPTVANRQDLLNRIAAILDVLDATGATPHEHPAPDGYPLRSQRQPGSAVYWQHGEYASRILTDTLLAADPAHTDPSRNLVYQPATVLMQEVTRIGANWNNANDVATAALTLLYDQRWTSRDLSNALLILNRGTPWPGTANVTESEQRSRYMTAFLCALPQAVEK